MWMPTPTQVMPRPLSVSNARPPGRLEPIVDFPLRNDILYQSVETFIKLSLDSVLKALDLERSRRVGAVCFLTSCVPWCVCEKKERPNIC